MSDFSLVTANVGVSMSKLSKHKLFTTLGPHIHMVLV